MSIDWAKYGLRPCDSHRWGETRYFWDDPANHRGIYLEYHAPTEGDGLTHDGYREHWDVTALGDPNESHPTIESAAAHLRWLGCGLEGK